MFREYTSEACFHMCLWERVKQKVIVSIRNGAHSGRQCYDSMSAIIALVSDRSRKVELQGNDKATSCSATIMVAAYEQ
jgi:hypothetical protein